MKRLEVLHLLGSAGYDGMSIVHIVKTIADGLDPARYRITVWFLGPHGPLVNELPGRALGWDAGVRDPIGAMRFAREIGRFDIVHLHQGARSVRWLVKRCSQAKLVVHLHGDPGDIEGADAVIATSAWVAGRTGGECTVVYPGVEVHDEEAAMTRTVGMACRLVEGKGVFDLLQAMEGVPGDIEIAGDGPLRPALERSGRARLLGFRRDVQAVMRNWALLAMPSTGEGFGLSALEAMACGLPVVGYRSGALPEVVLDGETGYLVSPGDTTALGERIMRLLDDTELRIRMGKAGRERARLRFRPADTARLTANVYERLSSA